MRLLVLQAFLISALYEATWSYNLGLTMEEQMALEELLAEAGADELYYPEAYYNPETRNENPDTNKPVIPPNTFVQGGAGEGKQHLGPNLIPNKPHILPEINPPVYDNPPNPCSPDEIQKQYIPEYRYHYRCTKGRLLLTDLTTMAIVTTKVDSVDKAAMGIKCLCDKGWEEEGVDCAEARKCCIPEMPNQADFVKEFQETGKKPDDNDIFQNLGYSKRTHYYKDSEKRAGHVAKKTPSKRSGFVDQRDYRMKKNPRNRYFVGPQKKTVVAKKAPQLASGRLPVM